MHFGLVAGVYASRFTNATSVSLRDLWLRQPVPAPISYSNGSALSAGYNASVLVSEVKLLEVVISGLALV